MAGLLERLSCCEHLNLQQKELSAVNLQLHILVCGRRSKFRVNLRLCLFVLEGPSDPSR